MESENSSEAQVSLALQANAEDTTASEDKALSLVAVEIPETGPEGDTLPHQGAPGKGINLQWSNLVYTIEDPQKKTSRCILDNVSGEVYPKQLLALMGPSGSGKTSLLNSLAGRVPQTKNAVLTGTHLVNGNSGVNMSKVSAYVLQDDALFALSTVFETLMFTAQLRLPGDLSVKAKEERVMEVITELNLIEATHTSIGNDRVRGVSGGERKRVSIGTELLHKPSLIFCDEPTSGLDSFQAQNVMGTLKELASRGNTVVCSIHQPRSSIYNMLDLIVLLAQGGVVYNGLAGEECEVYFAAIGYPVPKGFNPADHFLDVICVDHRTEESSSQSKARVETLLTRHAQSADDSASKSLIPQSSCKLVNAMLTSTAGAGHSSFLIPFMLLVRRSWREQMRDFVALCMKYLMNVFFTAVFGIVYWRMAFDQVSLQNRTGILFFQAMNQAFGSTIGISQVIPRQLQIVWRERASNMYNVLPYYCATMFITIPLEFLPQIVYTLVIYFMTNLRNGWDHFFIYLGVMVLENFVGISVGLLLSASLPSVEMAPNIAPAIVILFLMFSGYFLNEESLPDVLGWLKYISFILYSFQALCVNEFKDAKFSCSSEDQVCYDGNTWLESYLKFGEVKIYENCIILAGMMVGWNILAVSVLQFNRPRFLNFQNADSSKLSPTELKNPVAVKTSGDILNFVN
ncbi:hypothetical protein CYMTET_34063 [Cymbomonas tetramitiformis]|uniref:ABC transporter domain-containing protein n=1 Tax=Cymbomonas tetramitiformis TaxID=36881 RepID=A0AAE0FBS8_9CHLO|nr:hypothetical protein CYMTET_34063 [Cymbomonas tetramitiformis]|eukprot:gene16195-19219_t